MSPDGGFSPRSLVLGQRLRAAIRSLKCAESNDEVGIQASINEVRLSLSITCKYSQLVPRVEQNFYFLMAWSNASLRRPIQLPKASSKGPSTAVHIVELTPIVWIRSIRRP